MSRLPIPMLAFCFALSACSQPNRTAPPREADASDSSSDFDRGIALGLHSEDWTYDYGMLIGEIAAHNANWISLAFVLHQENGESAEMESRFGFDRQKLILEAATRRSRARQLDVLFFPIVLLKSPREGEWRGNLTPASTDAWFRNYRRQILQYAEEAERLGAAAFCIGSEFSSLEHHHERWSELIRDVRAIFSGRLLYSANWDHYDQVPFWSELDAIGISGYFELTQTPDPGLAELTAAWNIRRDRLLAWRERAQLAQPIVFTEIGYANMDGTNMFPWKHRQPAAAPDPEEQALCYAAFIRAWQDAEPLRGVFFYDWFGYDTLDDRGYSPRGKPAAGVIRDFYETYLSP